MDESFEDSQFDGDARRHSEDESDIIAEIRRLSTENLQTALRRGELLSGLDLSKADYENRHVGVTYRDGYRLIKLYRSRRIYRTDTVWSPKWTLDYELIEFPETTFARLHKLRSGNFYNITRNQIRNFRRSQWLRNSSDATTVDARLPDNFLNQIICGDCLKLIPQLPRKSIHLVVCSPPYVEKRDGFYESVPEEVYPAWICKRMHALLPVLTDDGSVIMIIRSHVEDGVLSDYVMRTRLAIRNIGQGIGIKEADGVRWFESDELYWLKPDAVPLGSNKRPRNAIENILWFSKAKQPYVDLKACGKLSKRLGFHGSRLPIVGSGSEGFETGTARITNVFEACLGEIVHDIEHPAMFPPSLVSQLIQTFSKEGDNVLDPFAGSLTTGVVARGLRRNFVLFDIEEKCVEMAKARLARLWDGKEVKPPTFSLDGS